MVWFGFVLFEAELHLTWAGLEFLALLFPPPKCKGSSCVPSPLAGTSALHIHLRLSVISPSWHPLNFPVITPAASSTTGQWKS